MTSGTKPALASAVLAALLVAPLAACQTASIDDLVPRAADARPAPDTGTYPDLNVAPAAAAPQFTDAERDARIAELNAAKERQAGPGVASPAANEARLKELARKRGEDTLKEIEGE